MTLDGDPMEPEAWFEVPDVCGSCIAWRSEDPKPGDVIAIGACKLRPELGRVPADLKKCDRYMQRGAFKYAGPAHVPERRRSKTVSILRARNHGEREVVERIDRRVEDREGPPPPQNISLGENESGPVFRQAMVELLRQELGASKTEMHPKFRGGEVWAMRGDGKQIRTAFERFYARVDHFKSCLDALEAQLEAKKDAFSEDIEDVRAQFGRMRGSFTTFNVVFRDKEDYFSSKE